MCIRGRGVRFLLTVILVSAMIMCTMKPALAGIHSGITKNSVSIGIIADLTGPAAPWGKAGTAAARILINHVNDERGIHGRKLKLFIQDSNYNPVASLAAAKYLITRHDVFCLYNVSGTAPMVVLFPLVESEKIPVLPAMNQASVMFDPPKRYVFHDISGVSSQAIAAADYIVKDLKVKSPKLAIFHQDDEWGRDGMRGWVRAAKHYGLDVVAQENFKRGSVDFTSQVLGLKRADPDYVFYVGTVLASVLKEAEKFGFKTQFIGDTAILARTIRLAGDTAKGILAVHDRATPEENTPGIIRLRKLAKKYAPETEVDHQLIWGYLNTMILFEGLRRAGKDLDREKLIDAMETFKDFDTGGISGPISYGPISQGPKSRRGVTGVRILMADIEKGYFVPITGWKRPSIE